MGSHGENGAAMGINFAETFPFVNGVIECVFDMLNFLFVGVLNDGGDFFNFIEFGKHIIDIVKNGLIFCHFFLFGFLLFIEWLSTNVFVFTHEISDVLIFILNN